MRRMLVEILLSCFENPTQKYDFPFHTFSTDLKPTKTLTTISFLTLVLHREAEDLRFCFGILFPEKVEFSRN